MDDISVDFVGGDDFGLAGHTPLHPMYVSYSALPPPAYSHKNSAENNYPTGTTSTHQSAYRESSFPKHGGEKLLGSARGKSNIVNLRNDTIRSNSSRSSSRDFQNLDCSVDYSNPLDHLQRPVSPVYDEYDSLDSAAKLRYQKNKLYYPHLARYSPVARIKCRSTATKQGRNPAKPRRVFIDHVRDHPLRSFYSDPRLAVDQHQTSSEHDRSSKRDSRPLSLYASNFWTTRSPPCFSLYTRCTDFWNTRVSMTLLSARSTDKITLKVPYRSIVLLEREELRKLAYTNFYIAACTTSTCGTCNILIPILAK